MNEESRQELRNRVRRQAGNRCGYCQSPQHLVLGKLEIEHLLPASRGGSDEESNLWLACRLCNFKSDQTSSRDPETGDEVPLYNPREQHWSDHFEWSTDGTRVLGTTPCGRATVSSLQLNNIVAVTVRRNWVLAGWHPPKDAAQF